MHVYTCMCVPHMCVHTYIHVHVPSGTVYKIQVMSPNVQIIIIFYLKIYNYGTRYQVMEHSVT